MSFAILLNSFFKTEVKKVFNLLLTKKNRLKKFGVQNIHGDNNLIVANDADLTSVQFNIYGNGNSIVVHSGVKFNLTSFNLYGDHHKIIIGKNCQFNGPSNFWAEDEGCLISIGRESTFEGVHLSATESESKLIIGEDCMFSYDIDVRTGDSHSLIDKTNGRRINFAKNIQFGNHVWVASHCIFTKGASIANGSVVGTGSLVNKPFKQENVIVAGHPAKIIRTNIEWLRERVSKSHGQQQVKTITPSKGTDIPQALPVAKISKRKSG